MAEMALTRGLSSGENAAAMIRKSWHIAQRVPGGKKLFSVLLGQLAPYTGTIGAQVEELSEGVSKVTLEDRRAVRNHLKCVHAVALANLVELAGNVALAYSMPDDARFIVAGLSVDYLKKARGKLVAEGRCPPIHGNERREYIVTVSIRNGAGEEVATGKLRTLVGPQRPG